MTVTSVTKDLRATVQIQKTRITNKDVVLVHLMLVSEKYLHLAEAVVQRCSVKKMFLKLSKNLQ